MDSDLPQSGGLMQLARSGTSLSPPALRLKEDLHLDDEDITELVTELESYFHIVLPADEVKSWQSVIDTCKSVERQLQTRTAF